MDKFNSDNIVITDGFGIDPDIVSLRNEQRVKYTDLNLNRAIDQYDLNKMREKMPRLFSSLSSLFKKIRIHLINVDNGLSDMMDKAFKIKIYEVNKPKKKIHRIIMENKPKVDEQDISVENKMSVPARYTEVKDAHAKLCNPSDSCLCEKCQIIQMSLSGQLRSHSDKKNTENIDTYEITTKDLLKPWSTDGYNIFLDGEVVGEVLDIRKISRSKGSIMTVKVNSFLTRFRSEVLKEIPILSSSSTDKDIPNYPQVMGDVLSLKKLLSSNLELTEQNMQARAVSKMHVRLIREKMRMNPQYKKIHYNLQYILKYCGGEYKINTTDNTLLEEIENKRVIEEERIRDRNLREIRERLRLVEEMSFVVTDNMRILSERDQAQALYKMNQRMSQDEEKFSDM
jgi:hypothetical protein